MTMFRRLGRGLAWLLSWPPTLLHELAHAAASEPLAEEVRLVDPLSDPSCDAEWTDSASGWAIAAAAYAPTLSGLLLAVAALLSVALGGGLPLPETTRETLVIGVGAVWYGIYVVPSADDIREAQRGLDRTEVGEDA